MTTTNGSGRWGRTSTTDNRGGCAVLCRPGAGGRQADGSRSSRPYVSPRSARRRGNSMAARGSGGLLLCLGLLLAMPVLAARPADRGECAASADKPDVGGAACSRIIDDASEQVAERVKAFKNRGRGSFNGKDYDRAIADYGEAIKLSPKDAWAFAHRCEAYESKEDHDAAMRVDSRDVWAYTRHGMAWTEKGEFEQAVADITEAVTIDPKYAFGFGQRGQALFKKRLITKK